MKNILALIVLCFTLISFNSKAQDCDSILRVVENYMIDEDGRIFVSDGQTYTAFLDQETAEFKTTLFGKTTYRIAASAGTKDDYVIFSLTDKEGNVLFTNKDVKNAPYWDFKVASTIEVIVETELDSNKKVSGCAVMLIGFDKQTTKSN